MDSSTSGTGDGSRIFFGSLEHTAGQSDAPATDAPRPNIPNVATEILPVSAQTIDEQKRHEKLLKGLEMTRTMREIAVPVQDSKVRARLVEIGEPMILFGEEKPERRERLRRICAERGISPEPSTVLKKLATQVIQEKQQEPVKVPGPKELKDFRIKLTESSLLKAQKRVFERQALVEELERTWPTQLQAFDHMTDQFSHFTEAASQVGDPRPLSYISFSPSGTQVATSSWSGAVKIWSVPSCALEQTLKAHTERAQCVEWNPHLPSNLLLATCGADNDVRLWSESDLSAPSGTLKGHTDRINRVKFHPHTPHLASSSFDTTWSLWDLETGKELINQGGSSRAIYGLAFHCDGALLAAAGLDAICRLWDLRSGLPIWTMKGHAKPIISVDISPNGFYIATGSDDRTIRVWDARMKKLLYLIPAHTGLVSSVAFQPVHGNYLMSSGYDNTVKVWSTLNWGLVKVLGGHHSKVSHVSLSPQPGVSSDFGDPYRLPLRFATASFDKTWKLWEYDALSKI